MNDWEVRVISETQQLRDRIRWLEKGLREIFNVSNDLGIRILSQSTLDGEPTTADEYNESQEIEGIELKHEAGNTMQEDEKLVFEEQFGNNDKQHDKNAEIAEYDRKYWEEEE